MSGLPEMAQLRDMLAMEYRRASLTGATLATLLISARDARREDMGQVANAVHALLRRGESLFRLSDTSLGLILPGMTASDLDAFKLRVHQVVTPVLENGQLRSISYPEEVSTVAEIERELRLNGM